MKPHYVLVEVRDNKSVGLVRKAIHETYPDADISDIIIRGDRNVSFYGLSTKEDYSILSNIFGRHMQSVERARRIHDDTHKA